MILDPSINVGNILTGLALLIGFVIWAFRAGADFQILRQQVMDISKKLDNFITIELVDEKIRSLQRQIDDIRGNK